MKKIQSKPDPNGGGGNLPSTLVRREPDDPSGIVRVSAGGDPALGYYCVYKGKKDACVEALKQALKALLLEEMHDITKELDEIDKRKAAP